MHFISNTPSENNVNSDVQMKEPSVLAAENEREEPSQQTYAVDTATTSTKRPSNSRL